VNSLWITMKVNASGSVVLPTQISGPKFCRRRVEVVPVCL
jgi:hypothetical protein